jgi:peptide-methionine (S)-S-oxide reductase
MRLNLTINKTNGLRMKKAYLASGCFWCTETIFDNVDGVTKVIPGYMGGTKKNPTYEEVCTGLTGHAELVEITYDSNIVSFKKLLEIFFKTHDPTTLNRQGNDIGTQYRSAIFFQNKNELNVAKELISNLESSNIFLNKIVTTLEEKTEFFEAEDYHKKYFYNNPENMYCQMVVKPKVEKFLNSKD